MQPGLLDAPSPTTWIISKGMPRSYSARDLLYLMRHAKSHPQDSYQIDYTQTLTAAEVQAWFMACLQRKINREIEAKRARWRRWHDDYQRDLELDSCTIRRYQGSRVRRWQAHLRTKEARRCYPCERDL